MTLEKVNLMRINYPIKTVRWRILGPVLLQVHTLSAEEAETPGGAHSGGLSAIWERKGPSVSQCWDHLLD